jgi:VWFA-related protein
MKSLIIIALSTTLIVASVRGAQDVADSGVRLRASTEFIAIDVSATDSAGHFVDDLDVTDFTVHANGVSRPIEAFERVSLPAPPSGRGGFSQWMSAVHTNAVRPEQRRIYLILVDEWHIARASTVKAKAALHTFIDHAVADGDLAAVQLLARGGDAIQNFTSDRTKLHAAVNRLNGSKLRSATAERLDDPVLNTSGVVRPNADMFAAERVYRAHAVLSDIRGVATQLKEIPGARKIVLWVSEGPEFEDPATSTRGRSDGSALGRELADTINALNLGNITAFPLDPRGITSGQEQLIESSSTFDIQGVGFTSARGDVARSVNALRTVASQTGGAVLFWRPDLRPAFDHLLEVAGHYYILGFRAPPDIQSLQHVKVSVRRKGVTLYARKDYSGTAASRQLPEWGKHFTPVLARTLASPLPVPGVRMALQAIPFLRADQPTQMIMLDVDLGNAHPDLPAGVRFGLLIFDDEERIRLSETQAIRVLDGQPHSAPQLHCDWFILLPPGTYRFRLAAETTNGDVGSVLGDLTVPSYKKGRLALTPLLVLGDTRTAVKMGAAVLPDDSTFSRTTLTRRFHQGQTLALRAAAFWSDSNDASVSASGALINQDGTQGRPIVFDSRTSGKSSILSGSLQLDVPPGVYRATLVAKRKGEQSTVETLIEVL